MSSKTFHFESEMEQVLSDLLDAYMSVSALCELLRGTVEAGGNETFRADELIHDWDQVVVAAIRTSGKLQGPPI